MEVQDHPNSHSQKNTQEFQKFWITQQQMYCLNSLLPTGYSFTPLEKITKRGPKKGFRVKQIEKNQSEIGKGSESGYQMSGRIKKTPSNMIYIQKLEKQLVNRPHFNKRYNNDFYDQQLKSCSRILNLLKNNRTSYHFRQPVNPVTLGIPNYKQIIQQPMDLQTIQNNLRTNEYKTATQFHADINKIIRNSYIFNKNNQAFLKITQQFQNYYMKVMSDSNPSRKNKQPNKGSNSSSQASKHKIHKTKGTQRRGRKSSHSHVQVQKKPNQSLHRPMSVSQKKQLIDNIRRLNKQDLRGLVKIIYPDDSMVKDSFDIQELDQQKLIEVQLFVRNKIAFPSQMSISHSHGQINSNKHQPSHMNQQSSFQVQDSD